MGSKFGIEILQNLQNTSVDCGGGKRTPTFAESCPSLGLCLLRRCSVACIMALVPELFQIQLWNWTWIAKALDLEMSGFRPKLWIFPPKYTKFWNFCSVKTLGKRKFRKYLVNRGSSLLMNSWSVPICAGYFDMRMRTCINLALSGST